MQSQPGVLLFFTFSLIDVPADPRLAIVLQEVGDGWCHAISSQESVGRLQNVDGVNIVMVGVGGVVDCSDSKQQPIELVWKEQVRKSCGQE